MRIVVYGAGAVGCAFAARLSEAHEVAVVARGRTAEAIRENGLALEGDGPTRVAHPLVLASGEPLGGARPDLVLVTLKAYSLPGAAAEMAALARGAPAVFAQNGLPWWLGLGAPAEPLRGWRSETLDPGGALARAFAPGQVVGGVVASGNTAVGPGRVRNTSPGFNRLEIGPAVPGGPALGGMADALSVGGLAVAAFPDPRPAMWAKLLFNVAFNPLSAATGLAQGPLLADPALVALARALTGEAFAVAQAAGADLPADAADAPFRRAPAQPGHKSSMLQDFEAGRPLELDALVGALVELGRTLGVAAPRLEAVGAIAAARAAAR